MVDLLFWDISRVIALVIVLGVILFFWMRPPRATSVEHTLKTLGNDYKVFRDILVTLNSGIYKIGYLVVSRYGVFLIEERKESGTVQVSNDQREWLVSSQGAKDYIYNPVWRAREAVNKLNDQGETIPVFSLIVFVRAKLKNNFNKDVISLGDLATRIKKESKIILNDTQVQEILDRLEKKNK
ncbi:MAG: nuclease-related domain-containing protein [Nitrospinales bacterium]